MSEYNYKGNASQYDRQVKEYDSYAHDVLFGMLYEYTKKGETLLDLGIGTGLASVRFAGIGLKVYGLDISEDMLDICKTKSFAEELKLHNLSGSRLPYGDRYFNHVISCGVFHFLGDLGNIFSDVSGVLQTGGKFAFTFAPGTDEEFGKEMTSWGVPIYKHSPFYLNELLASNKMTLLKEQRLLMKGADKKSYDMLFSVMVTEKR